MAGFELEAPLSRELWVEFGGFEGWKVEFDDETQIVPSGDSAPLERLLDGLAERGQSHLRLTRYEDDSLSLFMNRRRVWLMYLREPADSGLYVSNTDIESPKAIERFQCTCGVDMELPRHQTLDFGQAKNVAVRFFQTGELPATVEWTEEQ